MALLQGPAIVAAVAVATSLIPQTFPPRTSR